ncbi:MAG: endolytic transglycosylase MltG [Patescibacteria group bacterium]
MRYFNKSFSKHWKKNVSFIILALCTLALIVISQPPKNFPTQRFDIHVQKGDTISSVANNLYGEQAISSKFFFKALSIILSKNRGIFAGDYRFTEKQNLFRIAYRMAKGHQGQPKIRIVIPEGTNVYDMAYIFLRSLSDFNAPRFVSLAHDYEGYLYPDTYYFLANAKPEEIIRTMRENFNDKVTTIEKEIIAFKRPLGEIVVMASLVEKEAYADESRRIISGILWKRLAKGMALQVDAPFYYTTGKAGGFTLDDLRVDSPYNTYTNKGLPIAPISNPSLATILDTVTPIETPYWFYLTGNDGVMRYASTFDGHLANKNTYLK